MRAILVNADGTTEPLDPAYAAGLYYMRRRTCSECGTVHPDRKYRAEYACDRKDDAGHGTMVFIQVPA